MVSNLENDYKNFCREINRTTKNSFKIEESNKSFKRNHAGIYIFSLILNKLYNTTKDEHKLIFFIETLSDLLTSTKLSCLGFETSAAIILRRSIENFYSHFFYIDHPIEYYHLNSEKNEYTPIEELKKYFEAHPIFIKNKDDFVKIFNDSLFNEYHQLCRIVHSKGKNFMNLAMSLSNLKRPFDLNIFISKMINIEICFIYLSYKFYRELKFSPMEKQIITDFIPKNKREKLHE